MGICHQRISCTAGVVFQYCPDNYFTCERGSITCIDDSFVCDCVGDCSEGSDENKLWAGCDTMCNSATSRCIVLPNCFTVQHNLFF
ncbi:hypothetical protein DPMN_184597 [Dreissena polymorpha]|uniref:Uncharacterized protein n=1 Tax=Dreissena polymorpha TaxID=45954 RepID=A0A9D4DJ25_DREPO|nr:hypothetical protein DPMN_184597 [Dreissena polymorpha]